MALPGALVAAAVTGYLVWPGRRRAAVPDRHQQLIAYLRDHLSGSDVAFRVVRRLAATHASTAEGRLFRRLAGEFEQERAVLRSLLQDLGASDQSLKRAAGSVTGAMAGLLSGGETNTLSMLRTLEGLAIGVQGKRCLWRALQAVTSLPEIQRVDVEALEASAVSQWEAIDERRRAIALHAFT